MQKNKTPLFEETLLFFTFILLIAIYIYFFILIPQNWTLRDDYALINQWTDPKNNPWQFMLDYIHGLKLRGRFNILDAFSRFLHYKYLPVTPRWFHASYFALAAVATTFFGLFLRTFSLSRSQILLALVLLISNLSFKEMLTTLTTSEGMALAFFTASLFFFRTRSSFGKALSLPFFILSFLSKETFFVLCPVYFFLVEDSKKLKNFTMPLLLAFSSGLFALFIHSLPREYTQPLTLQKLTLSGLFKSFTWPVIKNFGPYLLLVFLDSSFVKAYQKSKLVLAGLSIVVLHTLLLTAWGPFDSWFYLHLAIPAGWCMILTAFWNPEKYPQKSLAGLSLLFLCLIYSVLATINGAKNYVDFFSSSTKIAELTCRFSEDQKHENIYSNCYEGSSQLMEYLAQTKNCKTPPSIQYFGYSSQVTLNTQKAFLFLKSKTCDQVNLADSHYGIDLKKLRSTLEIGPWEVLEYTPNAK